MWQQLLGPGEPSNRSEDARPRRTLMAHTVNGSDGVGPSSCAGGTGRVSG